VKGEVTLERHRFAERCRIDGLEPAYEGVLGRDVGELGGAGQVGQAAVVLVQAEAGAQSRPGLDPGLEACLDEGARERVGGRLHGSLLR
jgi:hypothetical protein